MQFKLSPQGNGRENMGLLNNTWQYSTIHKTACKVIDEQTLWDFGIVLKYIEKQYQIYYWR